MLSFWGLSAARWGKEKSEARNPKSERNPKAEGRKSVQNGFVITLLQSIQHAIRLSASDLLSAFGPYGSL
jgi:hypothetical protein